MNMGGGYSQLVGKKRGGRSLGEVADDLASQCRVLGGGVRAPDAQTSLLPAPPPTLPSPLGLVILASGLSHRSSPYWNSSPSGGH